MIVLASPPASAIATELWFTSLDKVRRCWPARLDLLIIHLVMLSYEVNDVVSQDDKLHGIKR